MTKNRWRLSLIMVLAFAVRCIALADRGIQYDDAFSIFLSSRSLPEIVTGTAADTMPPLYYFLLHFWLQVSNNLAWIRMLGVLLSLVSIVFLYLLVSRLANHSAGLLAAFFMAISPLQYYHAQDVRMYALLEAGQLGYAWFFTRIWFTNGRSTTADWFGLILCGTVAMYSHNLAIFFLVCANVILFINKKWKRLGQLIAAQAFIAVLFIPWLIMIPGQLAKVQKAFWTPVPGLVEVIQAITISTTNLPLAGDLTPAGIGTSLVLFFVVTWLFVRKGLNSKHFFLLILTLLPPTLLFIASYFTRPVFVTRGFIASTVGYLGIAAIVVDRYFRKPVGVILAAGFICAAIIGVYSQSGYSFFPRSPFQAAGKFLASVSKGQEGIIHDNKLSYFPTAYFEPGLNQSFLADVPGTTNDTLAPATQAAMGVFATDSIMTAAENKDRIFFVVFDETISEYAGTNQAHPQISWLMNNYSKVCEIAFQDLKVLCFER